MKTSEQTANVFAALAAAQAEMSGAKKGADNPAFKRNGKDLKYADLADHWDTWRPVAKAHGLAVLQELLTAEEQGVSVVTRICHLSGEWVEMGPLFVPASKHDAHGYGSACSYARRYALSAAIGTVAEDDDGNAAVEGKQKEAEQKKASEKKQADEGYKLATAMLDSACEKLTKDEFRALFQTVPEAYRERLTNGDRAVLDGMVKRTKQTAEAS